MDIDEYEVIAKKPLKLASKKERRKNKIEQRDVIVGNLGASEVIITTTTKAEEAFRSKQEEIAKERILKKASKTHKQRVEEFNKHLDSLSEHYDIPKVSWTK